MAIVCVSAYVFVCERISACAHAIALWFLGHITFWWVNIYRIRTALPKNSLALALHYKCVAIHVICVRIWTWQCNRSFQNDMYCVAYSNYSMRHTITRIQLNRHYTLHVSIHLWSEYIHIIFYILHIEQLQCVNVRTHNHTYEYFCAS